MICFDVYVNGKKLCRAGVGATGVLTAIVNWVGIPAGPSPSGPRRARREARLHVGGLWHPEPDENEHLLWHDHKLGVGDRITVRLVEAAVVDPPTRRVPGPPAPSQRSRPAGARRIRRQPSSPITRRGPKGNGGA